MSRVLASDYMYFAKGEAVARYSLAASGVADCTLADLGANLHDLALHGPNAYGYAPLVERIAARFGISTDCVVTAGGAAFANHLAFAALVSPGDEVLVEEPAYELLLSTLAYLGAKVRRFSRHAAEGWGLDPQAVAARLTPATRLVVLTDLHNPTGALAGEAQIAAVARSAAIVGARVLVDEVYLELMFRDGVVRTAFRETGNIVVTSSLTKAYGLSGLRCGWILAPADLAQRMRRLNDLFASQPPHVAERLGVLAFDRLPALRVRANAMVDANREAWRRILAGHPALEWTPIEQGATVFPRLLTGDVEHLFRRLKSDFETSVAPGRFFGCPDHFRVGLAGDPEVTRTGLERLARALEAG